jgi:hypothetical protein
VELLALAPPRPSILQAIEGGQQGQKVVCGLWRQRTRLAWPPVGPLPQLEAEAKARQLKQRNGAGPEFALHCRLLPGAS